MLGSGQVQAVLKSFFAALNVDFVAFGLRWHISKTGRRSRPARPFRIDLSLGLDWGWNHRKSWRCLLSRWHEASHDCHNTQGSILFDHIIIQNHTNVFNMHINMYIYNYIYKGSSMITYGQCFARDGEFQIDPIWPIWTLKDPKAVSCNCSDLRMKLYKGMSSLEVRLQRYFLLGLGKPLK